MTTPTTSLRDSIISAINGLELKSIRKCYKIKMLCFQSNQLMTALFRNNINAKWTADVLPILKDLGFIKSRTNTGMMYMIEPDVWSKLATESTQ